MKKFFFISTIFAFGLIVFLTFPKSIFAQSCGAGSDASCQGQSHRSSCGGGSGQCRILPNQNNDCACVTLPGGTPGPTTPPTQPIGWYAPDGTPCNRSNYHSYYSLGSCSGRTGFVSEGITPQSNCSTNGSGKCFLVTGTAYTQLSKSFWKQDSQSCTAITIPVIPDNAFDTLFQCRFGLPPDSSIHGSLIPFFNNPNQFEKIYVWIVDSQVGFIRFYEFPKAQLVNGRAISYSFNNLFPDKKYDVYIKAYGKQGVYLDKVTYTGSCSSPGCRSYPGVQIDFKATFPKPLAGSLSNQVSNEVFQGMIDKWITGQITSVQMSAFISQIARVPGLQKSTCDPKFPGGCNL